MWLKKKKTLFFESILYPQQGGGLGQIKTGPFARGLLLLLMMMTGDCEEDRGVVLVSKKKEGKSFLFSLSQNSEGGGVRFVLFLFRFLSLSLSQLSQFSLLSLSLSLSHAALDAPRCLRPVVTAEEGGATESESPLTTGGGTEGEAAAAGGDG